MQTHQLFPTKKFNINPKYQILRDVTMFFDFDGILSSEMLYDASGKTLKSAQYGARHALEIMQSFGAEIHIITGDSSVNGKAITKKITEKLPISSLIYASNFDKLNVLLKYNSKNEARQIYYAADDIFDVVIAKQFPTFTTRDAFLSLRELSYTLLSRKTDTVVIEILSVLLDLYKSHDFSYCSSMFIKDNSTRCLPSSETLTKVIQLMLLSENRYTHTHEFSNFTIHETSTENHLKEILLDDKSIVHIIKDFFLC